mmetsp:Transcript_6592/g.20573  ORF Transcript_6592/g.20573 Transcript_6592/m.20573 type:complete len:377 (-) Transcript_6592:45-1175(-)
MSRDGHDAGEVFEVVGAGGGGPALGDAVALVGGPVMSLARPGAVDGGLAALAHEDGFADAAGRATDAAGAAFGGGSDVLATMRPEVRGLRRKGDAFHAVGGAPGCDVATRDDVAERGDGGPEGQEAHVAAHDASEHAFAGLDVGQEGFGFEALRERREEVRQLVEAVEAAAGGVDEGLLQHAGPGAVAHDFLVLKLRVVERRQREARELEERRGITGQSLAPAAVPAQLVQHAHRERRLVQRDLRKLDVAFLRQRAQHRRSTAAMFLVRDRRHLLHATQFQYFVCVRRVAPQLERQLPEVLARLFRAQITLARLRHLQQLRRRKHVLPRQRQHAPQPTQQRRQLRVHLLLCRKGSSFCSGFGVLLLVTGGCGLSLS